MTVSVFFSEQLKITAIFRHRSLSRLKTFVTLILIPGVLCVVPLCGGSSPKGTLFTFLFLCDRVAKLTWVAKIYCESKGNQEQGENSFPDKGIKLFVLMHKKKGKGASYRSRDLVGM